MKTVIAVSGGVDSVVLLDMLAKKKSDELTVACFDHGMRPESVEDVYFVRDLAEKYKLEFVTKREELLGVNEELARDRRYQFLFSVAQEKQAQLATAHHLDDLVETVALNIQRGTRWRGLAGMSDERISRPLLKRTKSELTQYALDERLEWREDETNQEDLYARNRMRKKLSRLPYDKKIKIYDLWQKQISLRQAIDREVLISDFPVLNRYFLTMTDDKVAHELIYEYILRTYGVSLLSAQIGYILVAVKTGRPGSVWQIGQGLVMVMTARDVTITRDASLLKG